MLVWQLPSLSLGCDLSLFWSYGYFVWLSLLLWSASIVLPASSLVAYRLPPVLSRLSVPSRATFPPVRTVFPFRRAPSVRRFCLARTVFPLRHAPSARRFRPVRTVFPFRRAPSARRFCLARTVFPLRHAPSARRLCPARTVLLLRRAPSARRFRPARTGFSLRRALFSRRCRSYFTFPVLLCVSLSASLPFRPFSRSVPCRAFCAQRSFSFVGFFCTRRTPLFVGGLLGRPSH